MDVAAKGKITCFEKQEKEHLGNLPVVTVKGLAAVICHIYICDMGTWHVGKALKATSCKTSNKGSKKYELLAVIDRVARSMESSISPG